MNTPIDSQKLKQAAAELVSFIGSTATIMKRLFSEQVRSVKLVIVEAEVAHLNKEISDYPTRLDSTSQKIQENIDTLNANTKSRSAQEMGQFYKSQFTPLEIESKDRMAERKKLAHETKEFIHEKNVAFEKIIQALKQSGTTTPQIREELDKLSKKMNDLRGRHDKLVANEELLQSRLDTLANESLTSAKASGARVVQPDKRREGPEGPG